uniref:Uncharacterized protein n=1 Tax=viral metagenome TaxID=1070528 RepID=A0A6M3JIV6_9ZZZZ
MKKYAIVIIPQSEKWTDMVVDNREEAERCKQFILATFRNLNVEVKEFETHDRH